MIVALRQFTRVLGPAVRPHAPMLLAGAAAAMLATLAGLAVPALTEQIVDGPVAHGRLPALALLVAAVAGLGVVEAGLSAVRRVLLAGPTTAVEQRLREDLYAHLQRLPTTFHDATPSGQLLSRSVSDLATIRRFLSFGLIYLVVNAVAVVVGFAVITWLWAPFGLVFAVAAVPLVALCYRYELRYKVAARRAQDQVGDLTGLVEGSVQGIRVLKAFGRGRFLGRRFAAEAAALRATELVKVRNVAALWTIVIVLPETAIGAMLALGGYGVGSGRIGVGALVAAVTAMAYLRFPVETIGWLLSEAGAAVSATERYAEVLDAPVSIIDPAVPRPLPSPVRGAVSFSGVRFGYGPTEVLAGVDLELAPGETVALLGATGSGKTTLAMLLPRLADVSAGSVRVDGVDVRDLALVELRTVVACAFEDPVLFSASVAENVRLGAPGASDEQVRAALRVAHADRFVEALPWGITTRIGEQGLTLSGGQRQRLALARAVVGRPAVLVLDDPLSALDVQTEAEVERALRSVLTGVTALVVAHRPSTVALADRVALLSDGQIAAVGSHEELLARCPEYRKVLYGVDERAGVR